MKTKTKLIEVKLSMILVVAVPEDENGLRCLPIVRKQMNLMGYDKCNFQLVVDDCKGIPSIIDEMI